MTEKTSLQEKIEKFSNLFDKNNLDVINFDEFQIFLMELKDDFFHLVTAGCELAVLRDDYIQRMSGMLKAIAAVVSNRGEQEQILTFIKSLEKMNSKQLVDSYHKISANFRDTFPTSYGYLTKHHSSKEKITT